MKRHIVPSVLSADFANLARDVKIVQDAGAESVQIDVMDGHFVPNITVGADVVHSLRKASTIFLDVHLMITDPLTYAPSFVKAGANLLTLHYEACSDPLAAIREVRKLGVQVGLAIRPQTSDAVLYPLLSELDMALVMTVEPGFGGQAFMPEMLDKVRRLRAKLSAYPKCHLQVDGGINRKTALLAAEAGADSMVAGSAIFGFPDAGQAFRELQAWVDFPAPARLK